MKTVISITIISAIGYFGQIQSFAQEHEGQPIENPAEGRLEKLSPEERASKRTERIAAELGMTEIQKQKVGELMLAHEQRMSVLHEENKALREKMKMQRETLKGEMDQILTTEQKAKRDELKAKHQAQMQLKDQRCCKLCGK